MEVRIVRQDSVQTSPATDFVRVSTCSDPNDDTVTLATIQRVVEKPADTKKPGPKWHVKTLIMERPMTADAALGFATCYAARKGIPVVCAEFASEPEADPQASAP
jgi:hypothetical protein